MVDLSSSIGNLRFKNPILLASGTSGPELEGFTDLSKLGGIITKSITLKPKTGNPPPRIFETRGGLLNSIGLENSGVNKFIEEKLQTYRKLGTNVIASIAGENPSEYFEVARILDDTPIDALELNISCPNVRGVEFAKSPQSAMEITKGVKENSDKPVIVKLSPNVTDIEPVAKAAEESGADALSLINTLYGLAINVETKKTELGNITGGLSGPCIKPIALYYVYKVLSVVHIPVIGIGGIMNVRDALEFFILGAQFIELGTATFVNPNIGVEILDGIISYCKREEINNIRELVGSVKIR